MTAPQLSVDTVNKSASNNNISQIPETVKENSNKFSISENDRYVENINDIYGYKTIFYKGIMPSEVGFRFSSGL